jgi:hypothetical protein
MARRLGKDIQQLEKDRVQCREIGSIIGPGGPLEHLVLAPRPGEKRVGQQVQEARG